MTISEGSDNQQYWLTNDSDGAIGHLDDYHSKWTIWSTSPVKQTWIRNFIAYYSPAVTPTSWDSSFSFEGVQGELTRFFTPKARSLMRQLISLITKQRLAFNAMALTSGEDVMKDVKLANAITEQILQNERLDIKGEELIENALVMGAGFMKTTWRTDKGEPYTLDGDGNVIYTGGIDISVHGVFDVFYDVDITAWDDLLWVEVRTLKNRWDLIAQHPELEEELKAVPSLYEARGPNYWFDRNKQNNDIVCCYELFAKSSPALPQGRRMAYCNTETVMYDGPNNYGGIPVEPMMPEKILYTGLGYPKFTDILASNEMMDNCLSAIATNQSQFGVQSVTIPRGSNINVQELNGMRFVSFTPQNVPGGGKPEALQLTQSSPETFKFIDLLSKNMSDMSYVHPALQGQVPGATSGVAIATLTANAMEFINSIGKTYFICLEKTLMHVLKAYKDFAKLPQYVAIQGKNNQIHNKEFTGDALKNVNGIKFVPTNPLLQTIAGRLEVSQQLMGLPRDVWPDYVSILEGRPLSDIYKGSLSQEDLIFSENERLMEGEQVVALATDDHALHIQKHAEIMNDPKIRVNSELLNDTLSHIEDHKNLAQQTDPFLMAMVRTGKMPEGGMLPPMEGGPESSMAGQPPEGSSPSEIQGYQGARASAKSIAGPESGMPQDLPANAAKDLLDRAQ